MSFDIQDFSRSCIGPLGETCVLERVTVAPENATTMLFDFGSEDPNGMPSNGDDGDGTSNFEATWFPDERLLSIRTALSPLHFGAETIEDALWIMRDVNSIECRASSLSLVYMGESERDTDEELDELDTFITQVSLPIPEAFDDPAHWPLLRAMFRQAVALLFTELQENKRMMLDLPLEEETTEVPKGVTVQ